VCWFWSFQNPASFANHPCSSAPGFLLALTRSMRGKKEFSSDKKEKEQPFSRDATFCLCCLPSVPSSEKRRKIYRGIIGHGRGKKSRNAKTASSLFRFSKSNKPKRKQTGRCAEAQGLVVVGSKSPKSRRAKRIPFPSVRPKQSRNLTPVLLDDQRMQSSLLCW
jgi:hypothetical protein